MSTKEKSCPGEKAANPTKNHSSLSVETTNTADSQRYPAHIRLSEKAEAYLAGLAVDLMLAEVELWQLPTGLLQFYTFAHETGRRSRQKELDHANAEADRYYAEMCRRPAKPHLYPNRSSYAELERIRGNHARADQIDATNARRFAEVH